MLSYWYYLILLILILLAAADTWGDTHKTIMYGIAVFGLFGLMAMKAIEKSRIKSRED